MATSQLKEKKEWGVIKKINIIPPYNIVSEQADNFNKKFKEGEMYCFVTRKLVEPKKSLFDMDDVLTTEIDTPKLERDTVVKLYIEVPSLEHYQIQLLRVTYKVSQLYPCEIINSITKQRCMCESESAFRNSLMDVLTSDSISDRLSVLYSQVVD